MKRLRLLVIGGMGAIALGATVVMVRAIQTESDIAAHRVAVVQAAIAAAIPPGDQSWTALPPPVQHYFHYVFRDPVPAIAYAQIQMSGQFRRPRTEGFSATTATQLAATGTPAFVFSATTPILPGVWARAYDAYVEGEMEMKAKILSAIPVVDQHSSPALNQTSLRRWLLESPLYPTALLPGGPVHWEAIDAHHARAIVEFDGLRTSLMGTFRDDGSLESWDAEEDGDLTTPYHGSGEHVTRSDYEQVEGMMIPMKFSIARAAQGNLYPFWEGQVEAIDFGRVQ